MYDAAYIWETPVEEAIREFETEIVELNNKLRSEQELNSAAWAEYGSELCAVEMLDDEKRIRKKIKAADGIMSILVAVRDHDVDLDRKKEEVETSIRDIDFCLALLEKRTEDLRAKKIRKEAKFARVSEADQRIRGELPQRA